MNASVYNLPLGHITSYLKSEGWELVSDNERWYVFEGCEDIEGDPFEIVLPKNINAPDYRTYVQHTVNILASLTDKAPQTVADDILLYDRDVLMIRILENVDTTSSIPIHLAAKQIPEIKQLIAYAACSEKNAKTYFDNSASGNKMLKHYRFGHTIASSFGYRIESPVGKQERLHQIDMFKDEPEVILPLPRRVMERIIRGLAATEEAARLQNAQPLVDGYESGFNANMCDAIFNMSEQQKEPIEYSIKWSNKISVSEDLRNVNNIRIQRRHFEYLETASEKLKELQPKFRTIEGHVVGLSSRSDPQSEDEADRLVTIHWYPRSGRSRKIQTILGKKDYLDALKAHENWYIVSVQGFVQPRGSKWQLSEPREFKILR